MHEFSSRLLTAAGVVAFIAGAVPVRAQEAPLNCPGDTLVWISGEKYYPDVERSRPAPGHFACRSDAERGGFIESYLTGRSAQVVDSVWDAMDGRAHRERPGYGRYTYVLLTGPKDTARNEALLSALMASTPYAETTPGAPPKYLNVFEVPATAAFWRQPTDDVDFGYVLAHYDFGMAHALLVKACAAPPRPAVCKGDLTGPFLLTYGRPLAALNRASPPYLIVDLHRLNVKGFVHMIALMKKQVKGTDVADAHLVEGLQVRLLSTALDVSEWLPELVSSVKSITALVEK